MLRYTIHFEGRVQGVGFRYRTCNAARAHSVAGYVQNLADGRVCLVAEGEPKELQGFLQDVLDEMAGNITRHTVDETAATNEFGAPAPGKLTVRY